MSSDAERLVRPDELRDGGDAPAGRRVATVTGRSPFRLRARKPKHRREGPAVD